MDWAQVSTGARVSALESGGGGSSDVESKRELTRLMYVSNKMNQELESVSTAPRQRTKSVNAFLHPPSAQGSVLPLRPVPQRSKKAHSWGLSTNLNV